VVLPEAFLAVDEILARMVQLVEGMTIDETAVRRTLATYGVFAATERVLMEVARRGGNRQEAHERIRQHSLHAWERVQRGEANPLRELLASDTEFSRYLSQREVHTLLDASHHVGNAPERARALAARIRETLADASGAVPR